MDVVTEDVVRTEDSPLLWQLLHIAVFCICLLGSVVIFGWHTHNQLLIQFHSTFLPMRYNTAVGFVLTGLGLLALFHRHRRLCSLLGCLLSGISFITLLQDLVGVNLGIDQLFTDVGSAIYTPHPGRMSPNSALSFTLIGLLFILEFWHVQLRRFQFRYWMFGVVITILGFVPLLGYIIDVPTNYEWGQLMRMAPHSCVGLTLVSLTLLGFAWLSVPLTGNERRFIISLAVLAFGFGMALFNYFTMQIAQQHQMRQLWQQQTDVFADATIASVNSEYAISILLASMLMAIFLSVAVNYYLRVSLLQQQLLAIQNASTSGLIGSDLQGRIMFANSAAETMFDYSAGELIGRKIEELIPFYKKSPSGARRAPGGLNMHGLTQDGREFPLDVGISFAATPEAEFVISSVIDITERKKLEDLLKEKNELLEYILEQTNDGWMQWDLINQEEEFLSERFRALLGYQFDDLPEQSPVWQALIHPDDLSRVLRNLARHLDSNADSPFWQEVRFLHKEGTTVWTICQGKAYKNKEGVYYRLVGTFTNITHLKQMEIQLRKRNKELDDFSYIVSHDLKAPLRGIYTLADWIYNDNVEILSADAKQNLNALQKRTKRMGMLIEGILKYSRVGRGAEETVAIDMHQLMQDVIEMLQPPAGIEIFTRTQLPVIHCDRIQLEQVFQNLLGNAIKHMGKSVGTVEVNCVAVGQHWHFSVKDTGPGIEQRYYHKIFEMFSTLVPRDVVENTGVGLCITKKIIEHFGGEIWVESVMGEGSTFHFTLLKGRHDKVASVAQAVAIA